MAEETKEKKETKKTKKKDNVIPYEEYAHRPSKTTMIILGVVALALFALLLLGRGLSSRTYANYRILTSLPSAEDASASYAPFADSWVRYSLNGIAYLTSEGEELWNRSYEMTSPIIDTCKKSLVVADKGGNRVLVFNEKGLKGQYTTNMPIVMARTSDNGIVAMIVRDESKTKVVTYDSSGKMLTEGKTSLQNTGYPMSLDISEDGTYLMVAYVSIGEDVTSKVVCYHFNTERKKEKDNIALQEEYPGLIIPEIAYINSDTCVAFGDTSLLFFTGTGDAKLRERVDLDRQIKSVAHDQSRAAVVLKNTEGDDPYELVIYGDNGSVRSSTSFAQEYTSFDLVDDQTILYNDNFCEIFRANGEPVFAGEFERTTQRVIPIAGYHKYIFVTNDEIEVVRLAR